MNLIIYKEKSLSVIVIECIFLANRYIWNTNISFRLVLIENIFLNSKIIVCEHRLNNVRVVKNVCFKSTEKNLQMCVYMYV